MEGSTQQLAIAVITGVAMSTPEVSLRDHKADKVADLCFQLLIYSG